MLDLEEGSSLDSSPLHLVEDSKDSRHLEVGNKGFRRLAEDNNKEGRRLHHHLRTRHKNQLPYTPLTQEQSEAVFTVLPMCG
jgi:hypothetical protein